jgi:hypothetical protein
MNQLAEHIVHRGSGRGCIHHPPVMNLNPDFVIGVGVVAIIIRWWHVAVVKQVPADEQAKGNYDREGEPLTGSSLHFSVSRQQKEIDHSAPPWESAHPIHKRSAGTIFVF